MAEKTEYQTAWRKLTLDWGRAKIVGWHQELETVPPPPEARQIQLNMDIQYMGSMLERIEKSEV
jgi:hypothetical protein